ncbi:hypothetical protein C479_06622 [Halovivax asiaticus JCM 14624]|uniref:DUF7282 domain-containing protein n=1 Tax=Halovivax asiaticus JCM 14624 TaxID=1227490 RepID=M0BN29_9EURY|nr:hypothetical protein [Halovivax asiaticus]ELZ11708.1 hypothetical protein C479_06622 [Halovivax asiaticus JCM 14624]
MSPSTSLGRLKLVVAVLIAIGIVVGAGLVVGQAPELFGAEVAQEPEASLTFDSQESDGQSVVVSSVSLSEGGFVVVTDESGSVVGVSEHLSEGSHDNVTVEATAEADGSLYGSLTATAHIDSSDDRDFDPRDEDGESDRPYVVDGYPVSETASVTAVERPEDVENSFVVTSLSGPSEGRTSEPVEFVAEIRNPTANELRQHAEFRVDGDLYERKVFSLAADETREVTYEVDLADIGNGTHTYGVYTERNGTLDEIDVEYDGPAHVTVENVSTSELVVEAGVPEGGYVAVEDDNGTRLATSDRLSPGVHAGVELDVGNVTPGSNLTAIVYRDDPAAGAEPAPYELDDNPVRATVQVPEAETD